MKRLCTALSIALLASCNPAWAQDLNVREIRRVVDAREVVTADRLPWYAGESVGYTILSRRGTNIVEIPAGSVPVWTVLDAATNAYVVSTGSVVNATNGEVRFWLPAPQANLPAGDYLSFATAYQGTNRIGGRAPRGARGLKHGRERISRGRLRSRPARGAWIETPPRTSPRARPSVAPRAGRVD